MNETKIVEGMRASNEPDENQSTFLIDGQNLASQVNGIVKNQLNAYAPLPDALTMAHTAVVTKDEQAKEIAPWPKNIFIPIEAILSYMGNFVQSGIGAFARFNPEYLAAHNISEEQASAEMENLMITAPTALICLLPWTKTRTLVHVRHPQSSSDKNQEIFDPALLDQETSVLSALPQWSMLFEVADLNIIWNERKIIGMFFARYVFTDHDNPGKFIVDNLVSYLIFDDGSCDLGPFVALNEGRTIRECIESGCNKLLEHSMEIHQATGRPLENIQNEVKETINRTTMVTAMLLHVLKHSSELIDNKNMSAAFGTNPEPVKVKEGYQLFDARGITELSINC